MKPHRFPIAAISLCHLTLFRGISNWPWRMMTLRKQLLEQYTGLFEFILMPFGLSNAGSSFCYLMEQCLGDKQFVTLLLYLDDICIFALSIEVMLDQIELVFNRLKEYHLKIKPKTVTSLTPVFYFWVIYYHLEEYQQTPRKLKRCGTGQFPQMLRKYIPS